MDLFLDEDLDSFDDPMDVVEAVLREDDRFTAQRADDGDMQFTFRSAWGEAVGYFSWRDELPALLFTVSMGVTAPAPRRPDLAQLLAKINEHLWLGHFDLWADDGAVVFRHALPMIGRPDVSIGEVQALLAAALDAVDRFRPALDFVVLHGKDADEAAAAALFEIAGEA